MKRNGKVVKRGYKWMTPSYRLQQIARLLEERDRELLAADGPVPQDPPIMRSIYLLATAKVSRSRGTR